MDENLPLEDQLMKYLDHEMSPEEREAFERQLHENPELKSRLGRLLLAQKAIQHYGIHDAVQQVRNEFEKENPGHSKPAKLVNMRRPLRRFLVAAASIVIIAAGVIGYLLYQLSPEKTYNENYVAYNPGVARGNDSSFRDIEKAYQEKNYTRVVQLSKNTSVSARQKLLAGLSYMQLNDFDKAITEFKEIVKEASPYKPDAEYYLALSYLRTADYDAALQLLKKIKNDPSHVYHNQISQKMISEVKWLKWKS